DAEGLRLRPRAGRLGAPAELRVAREERLHLGEREGALDELRVLRGDGELARLARRGEARGEGPRGRRRVGARRGRRVLAALLEDPAHGARRLRLRRRRGTLRPEALR